MDEDRRVSVVVTIPDSNPSPANAIASIIRNRAHVKDLHIVQRANSRESTLAYGGAADHQRQLADAKIDLVWHSEFNPALLQTRAMVELEPDHRVTEAAFVALKKDMLEWPDCQHFCVSSILHLNTSEYTWHEIHWYGLLFPLLVVDWLAGLVTFNQHGRTVDMRATLVQSTWPSRTRVARQGWWRWWFGTGVCWTRSGDVTCMQMPLLPKDRGAAFVWRTIKAHRHMTIWKPWWLLLFTLYYMVFSPPWWLPFFGWSAAAVVINPLWIAAQVAHWMLFVTYVTWSVIELPKNMEGVMLLLYPLYLMVCPLFFIYGRWHTSRAIVRELADREQREQLGRGVVNAD